VSTGYFRLYLTHYYYPLTLADVAVPRGFEAEVLSVQIPSQQQQEDINKL